MTNERSRRVVLSVAALLAPSAGRADEAPDLPPLGPPASFTAPPVIPTTVEAPFTIYGVSGRSRVRTDGSWGTLTSQIDFGGWAPDVFRDPSPLPPAWKRQDAWDCPLAGPFTVYGKLNGAEDKVEGRAGVRCKVGLWGSAELELRSGPSLTCTDPMRQDRAQARSEWLLEVQARWPLLASVGLEYQGVASPALTPLDKDRISHDLRLAIPVGPAGKFSIGARQKLEAADAPRSVWSEAREVYLGLELVH
jgi:hypothetical protein